MLGCTVKFMLMASAARRFGNGQLPHACYVMRPDFTYAINSQTPHGNWFLNKENTEIYYRTSDGAAYRRLAADANNENLLSTICYRERITPGTAIPPSLLHSLNYNEKIEGQVSYVDFHCSSFVFNYVNIFASFPAARMPLCTSDLSE